MILTWSSGEAGHGMSETILTDLASVIARHPWFQARAKLAVAVLHRMNIRPPARVLDAGCGWGLNLAALERAGYRAAGLDVSRRALQRLERPDRELIEADLTQPLPEQAGQYDAVLALDVIEHLDDDRGAVARLAQLTRPGGAMVISVPALPELFSEFDQVQGHRRRYSPDSLRAAFADTGASVESVFWWGGWMVPVLKRQRKHRCCSAAEPPAETYRRYLSLPPWPVPAAMRLLFALDQARALSGKSRVGTSLFALARRTSSRIA
jgi:SAM-dependent methyltransferase